MPPPPPRPQMARRTPHGALVHAMSAWSVKTRRAPSRQSREARVNGLKVTNMQRNKYIPPASLQVGVPKSIALNLTVPELVTAFNVEEMAQLVARGPLEHPGARYTIVRGCVPVSQAACDASMARAKGCVCACPHEGCRSVSPMSASVVPGCQWADFTKHGTLWYSKQRRYICTSFGLAVCAWVCGWLACIQSWSIICAVPCQMAIPAL